MKTCDINGMGYVCVVCCQTSANIKCIERENMKLNRDEFYAGTPKHYIIVRHECEIGHLTKKLRLLNNSSHWHDKVSEEGFIFLQQFQKRTYSFKHAFVSKEIKNKG